MEKVEVVSEIKAYLALHWGNSTRQWVSAQLWWCIRLLWAQTVLKASAACFKDEERSTGTVDGFWPHWVASAMLEHSVLQVVLTGSSTERHRLISEALDISRSSPQVLPAWRDSDSAVLYSRNHIQKLSGACHLRSLLNMFLPVWCMRSEPAALLGYPKEIWSGLLSLVRK